jgi:predicted transcriptional regulator
MPEQKTPRDVLAETMDGGRKVIVPLLAEMLKRKGIDEVDTAEQRRRFWQRALTVEQEQQLWQQAMIERGLVQLTPGDPVTIDIGLGISKMVYPDRWDMLPGEGRDHASQQAEWAWKMAKAGPPKPKADEQQPAPPDDGGIY